METCFGGYDDVVALPAELLDGAAHDSLALALGIAFGAVEKVDSDVVGGFEAGVGFFCGGLAFHLKTRTTRRGNWEWGISDDKKESGLQILEM